MRVQFVPRAQLGSKYLRGLVAQLVEHSIRIAGVRGSTPLESTMKTLILATTNPWKVEWFRYYLDKYKNDINLLSEMLLRKKHFG